MSEIDLRISGNVSNLTAYNIMRGYKIALNRYMFRHAYCIWIDSVQLQHNGDIYYIRVKYRYSYVDSNKAIVKLYFGFPDMKYIEDRRDMIVWALHDMFENICYAYGIAI